jgi:hypothetical protein
VKSGGIEEVNRVVHGMEKVDLGGQVGPERMRTATGTAPVVVDAKDFVDV